MKDGLQVAPRSGIAEYQVSQGAPVKFTVLCKDAGAEPFDHPCKPGCARCDDRTSRHIGVDDGNPQVRESLRNRALAAGDAAGKPDAQAACHD
jgi:hypothetical protein